MKFSSIFTLTTVAALTLAATGVYADQIGDKAKALDVSEWVKGQPVDVTDGKNVYVVEFWATWCSPCTASIPHLTGLQKEYKDKNVVFVGISMEDLKTVKPFVEEQGEKMDYTVVLDSATQSYKNYMTAFGQVGIPCAFIVNKEGRVAWAGHPMVIDKILAEIVDGTYDLDKAIKDDELRAKLYNLLAAFNKSSDKEEMKKIAVDYIKLAEKDEDSLSKLAEKAFNRNEDALAEMALGAMSKIDETSAGHAKYLKENAVFGRLTTGYKEALKGGKTDKAKKVATEIEAFCSERPYKIVGTVTAISRELKEKADVKFLMKLIDIFAEKYEGKTSPYCPPDVYRVIVYYHCKDFESGDKLKEQALDSCKNAVVRENIKETIEQIKEQNK